VGDIDIDLRIAATAIEEGATIVAALRLSRGAIAKLAIRGPRSDSA
jgi:hypothetical protein